MSVIGIDVGGSGLRAAVVENGRCGDIRSVYLESRSVEAVLTAAESLVAKLGPCEALGVAVPGFADGKVIHSCQTFPSGT